MKNYTMYMNLIREYGKDEKELLRNHPSLDVLKTWSSQREGLIEWISTDGIHNALVLYMDPGTPIGVLLRRGISTDILCDDEQKKLYIQERYKDYDSLIHIVESLDDVQDKVYDSLWMISTDNDYRGNDIDRIKKQIKTGGLMVYACANSYGIRYILGAPLPTNNNTIEGIKKIMSNPDIYYLMPDIFFPVSIYTDEHLPSAQDLTNYIALYDDPEYAGIDMGEKYLKIIEDKKYPEYAGGYTAISHI